MNTYALLAGRVLSRSGTTRCLTYSRTTVLGHRFGPFPSNAGVPLSVATASEGRSLARNLALGPRRGNLSRNREETLTEPRPTGGLARKSVAKLNRLPLRAAPATNPDTS
jgi:hypothetical protein